ncbi:MAG: hypothetical protein LBE08_06345 [Bifidobacteriaceae bacterium]|jgi:hypothetical protein|nr:hypothetical protein [Bifidobacteriaceae bacterium]
MSPIFVIAVIGILVGVIGSVVAQLQDQFSTSVEPEIIDDYTDDYTDDEWYGYYDVEVPTAAEIIATRNNEWAEATILTEGTYVAGQDFEPGRYVITAAEEAYFIDVIVDPQPDSPAPHTMLAVIGGEPDSNWPLSVTLTLPQSAIVYVDAAVHLTPAAPPTLLEVLGQGDWDVGIDLEAGTYQLAPVGSIPVSVLVLGPPVDGEPAAAREIESFFLDSAESYGEPTATVTLNAGESLAVVEGELRLTRL